MGLRIPPPDVVVECANWEVPAETPPLLFGSIFDVARGFQIGQQDPPNKRLFSLSQGVGVPCRWKFDGWPGDFSMEFVLNPLSSHLYVTDGTAQRNQYFSGLLGQSPYPMFTEIPNTLIDPFRNWGVGGYAVIFWISSLGPGGLAFGLGSANDLMLEFFMDDEDFFIVKLCSLSMNTNVSMKIPR